MSDAQKAILFFGLFAFVLAGIFPPWSIEKVGKFGHLTDIDQIVYYNCLFVSFPELQTKALVKTRLDAVVLGMEWILICVTTGGLCLVCGPTRSVKPASRACANDARRQPQGNSEVEEAVLVHPA
jgi:hypothetical protein